MFNRLIDWLCDATVHRKQCNRHVYIAWPPDRVKDDVHSTYLTYPSHEDLCNAYNLIPGSENEGNGWWEQMEVVRTKGFTEDELWKFIDFNRSSKRKITYFPQNLLWKMETNRTHVLGFSTGKEFCNGKKVVVWIHLVHND